jgi:hypothetical protein
VLAVLLLVHMFPQVVMALILYATQLPHQAVAAVLDGLVVNQHQVVQVVVVPDIHQLQAELLVLLVMLEDILQ